LEECCVIFRGNSLSLHAFGTLASPCMFNFGYAWTLICLVIIFVRLTFCGWELELVVNLWWSMIVISFCLSYGLF
jgi:hypothetical protein